MHPEPVDLPALDISASLCAASQEKRATYKTCVIVLWTKVSEEAFLETVLSVARRSSCQH